jgi:tRNA (guanosine-2'-O-)-methyltransferase
LNCIEPDKLIEYLKGFLSVNRIEKIDSVLKDRTKHITVVLEDIYHPHNASAVVRTCDCFGVQNLHVIENTKSYKVNKCVTQGSGKWVSFHRYNKKKDNTENCLMKLKREGYHIAATSLRGENVISIEDLPVDQKTALCFGTEELGLSKRVHDLADSTVKIPMFGFSQSLNISVCAALCLYNLTKRLRSSDFPWRLQADERNALRLDWMKKSIKNADVILRRFNEDQ